MSGSSAVQQIGAALRVAEDITELMGQTPMLHLRRVARPEWAAVYAKLEFLNPGGSVKDRAALGMILDAERRGISTPGSTIVEATAGNTGVGLALVGVNRGYRVVLFVPEGFAEEKCILMRGFGATVIRTPETEGMRGAIRAGAGSGKGRSERICRAAVREPGEPAVPSRHNRSRDMGADGRPRRCLRRRDRNGRNLLRRGALFEGTKPGHLTVAVETQGSVLQGGEPGPHKVEGIGVSFVPGYFRPRGCGRNCRWWRMRTPLRW